MLLAPGPAKKVTIHLNEDTSAQSDFSEPGNPLFPPPGGRGGRNVAATRSRFRLAPSGSQPGGRKDTAQHMPLRIEFIDLAQNVDRLIPSLMELVTDGMIEAHDTVILKAAVGKAR